MKHKLEKRERQLRQQPSLRLKQTLDNLFSIHSKHTNV